MQGDSGCGICVHAGIINALLQFKNAMMEIESCRIEKKLQTILQKKALSVDLGCFERPKFYDSYVKALSETSQRAMKVLDNFCDLIVDTITVCSIGVLIFQIDPIFVLLAVLPFIGTLLLGGKYNDLKYERDMKNQEISREKDYVQRVFYLSDYAKELRLTQMYQVMLQKMKQGSGRLKEIRQSVRFFDHDTGIYSGCCYMKSAFISFQFWLQCTGRWFPKRCCWGTALWLSIL